jgi:hypothetical protein
MNLKPGSHKFNYLDRDDNPEKPVTVWYHRPSGMNGDTPVIFIMPGLKRNGREALDIWSGLEGNNKSLLLVPEFSTEYFPRMDDYIFGNMFSSSEKSNIESEWTFLIIAKQS